MIDALLANNSQYYAVARTDLLRLQEIVLHKKGKADVLKRQQELNLAAEIY